MQRHFFLIPGDSVLLNKLYSFAMPFLNSLYRYYGFRKYDNNMVIKINPLPVELGVIYLSTSYVNSYLD